MGLYVECYTRRVCCYSFAWCRKHYGEGNAITHATQVSLARAGIKGGCMQATLHIPAMCRCVYEHLLTPPEIGAAVGSVAPKSQHDGAQVLQVGGAGGARGVEVRVAEQVLPQGVPGTT